MNTKIINRLALCMSIVSGHLWAATEVWLQNNTDKLLYYMTDTTYKPLARANRVPIGTVTRTNDGYFQLNGENPFVIVKEATEIFEPSSSEGKKRIGDINAALQKIA